VSDDGLFDPPAHLCPSEETIEWATRWVREIPGVARVGQIDPAPNREYAEQRARNLFGGSVMEVVSRTVITHTGPWSVT